MEERSSRMAVDEVAVKIPMLEEDEVAVKKRWPEEDEEEVKSWSSDVAVGVHTVLASTYSVVVDVEAD